jgi:AsmA protein
MRKLGIVIGIVILLLVVAALLAPRFIDVNRYHDRIQAELSSKLGRQVTVGTMHLSLLPLSFRVDQLSIADDPRFQSAQPFAVADQVTVSPVFRSLLHNDVEVKSLALRQPKLELVRDQQGIWNFSTLGQTTQHTKQSKQFTLDSLKIDDGQVGITDLQKRQARAVYDHIDLELTNFAPDKRFGVTLAAHLPGSGAQKLRLEADAGPLSPGDTLRTPIDGKLKLDQVSLTGLKKFLNSQALKGTDASLTGELSLKNENGVLSSSGNLKAEQVSLHGEQIGYPISADYKLSDDLNSDQIKVERAALKLGSTPLNISGSVNAKNTPAQVDLKIQASDVSLTEAARLAQTAGVAFGKGTNVAGRVNADISAKGAADKPVLNGQLNARDVVISGKDLPQPVRVGQLTLNLTPQAVQSNDFDIATGGTSLKMHFTLTNYATPVPAIDAAISTGNASLAEVLNIAHAWGVSATEGVTGSGMLDLNVHAAGPLKNTNAMNFSGTGRLQNANIKTASLTKPLIVRNAGLQFSSNSLTLQDLQASIGQTTASGQATVRNFAAPAVQFTLNADKINVAEWEQMFNSTPAKTARTGGGALLPKAYAEAPPKAPASPLANMSGGGNVSIGMLDYDQLQLSNIKSPVTLDHGVIRLAPLTAQVYGGSETGSITIDTRTTPSRISMTTSLAKVDANKLLSSVSSLKQTLYGLLAGNANSSFALGSSADAIARSLNGNLSIDLSNGRLANMDLLSQIASIGKFLNGGGSAKPFTNLLKLTGNFNVVNGIATTNDLKAVLDEGASLAAAGNLNLVNNAIDMHVTAVLPKGLSDSVGGTNIGGFMQTALANRNGELVVPILVSGSLSSPHFAPDLEKLAQMKLQNLVPTLQNPGGLISGILGGGKNGNAQNPVGDILGALGGKQPKQQQQNQNPQNPQQPEQNQQALPQSDQQPQSPFDILNSVINQQQKKKQQQQQQQQKKQQNPQQQPQL